MKTPTAGAEQFLTDARGRRTAVVLDLRTYEHLRETEEELADLRAYDVARGRAQAEIAAGHFTTLSAYRARRVRKAK